ncbi:MAG: VOC family protein [Planctomycetota bacterium]|nr:VOC family protein [Planctomycetota bacterium]
MLRLGEINLFVRDLDRSAAFYKAALGFEPCEQSEPPGTWLKVQQGAVTLLFFRAPADAGPCGIEGEPGMSADLMVEDFDAAYAALQAAGADVEPVREGEGIRFTVFRDPDGIRWELLQA